MGGNASFAQFTGDTSRPLYGQLIGATSPNSPIIFGHGHSNICDKITGRPLILSNGMVVYDSLGNKIDNGDFLVDTGYYYNNAYPCLVSTQGSMIIPKGDSGQYYLFNGNVTDSVLQTCWLSNLCGNKAPHDQLRYQVIDMNLNGGSGKVIKKNQLLLDGVFLSRSQMQLCKHANGKDWWLLKPGMDTNIIYRFLVTKDSIYGPQVQAWPSPHFGAYDATGQIAFGDEGSKYAAVIGKSNLLMLADFDRCSGELYNVNYLNIPIDSTYNQAPGWELDIISTGVSFSPNGKFVYISKYYHIYQYEIDNLDSSQAWYTVKSGSDTTTTAFEYYWQLYNGIDGRLYIGKGGGSFTQFSVIDHPNIKGAGCGFCRKCFRIDNALGGLTSPTNMPDYNLGPTNNPNCWPVSSGTIKAEQGEFVVYPNPASSLIHTKPTLAQGEEQKLYSITGQLMLTTKDNSIDVSTFAKGVYYLKRQQLTRKVIIE